MSRLTQTHGVCDFWCAKQTRWKKVSASRQTLNRCPKQNKCNLYYIWYFELKLSNTKQMGVPWKKCLMKVFTSHRNQTDCCITTWNGTDKSKMMVRILTNKGQLKAVHNKTQLQMCLQVSCHITSPYRDKKKPDQNVLLGKKHGTNVHS